jgi:uncharacterized protein
MTSVTPDLVVKAYDALASGDVAEIKKYWADDLRWLVPGHNVLSGWKNSLAEFLAFMGEVGRLSGNSFRMERSAILITGDSSGDITRNIGQRADHPEKRLDIDVIHVLRWRDGKVVEGRGAIFGDGTDAYDRFWSPV